MSENSNFEKKVIELSAWESAQMEKSLQFLIDDYIKDIENVKEIPNEILKAMSWLLAWKQKTFRKVSVLPNQPEENN